MRYSCAGRAATGTTGEILTALWNPASSGRTLRVLYFSAVGAGGAASAHNLGLQRVTARGTPGSSITPDPENAWRDHADAPVAIVDMADYTAAATIDPSVLWRWKGSEVIAQGVEMWTRPYKFRKLFKGIEVPEGTGLAITGLVAAWTAGNEITWTWEE